MGTDFSRFLSGSRRPLRALVACAAAIELAACGDGQAPVDRFPRVEVRDSAGVAIVDNGLVSRRERIYAEFGPVRLRMGGSFDRAAGSDFSRIVGAARLGDGRVIVADEASREVRVFDSSGRFEQSLTRKGDGPGELRYLSGIAGASGDTVWAWDRWSRRLVWLRTDGELLGTSTVGDGRASLSDLRRVSDGSFIGAITFGGSGGESTRESGFESRRDSIAVVRLHPAGAEWDTLVVVPHREWLVKRRRKGETISEAAVARPFGRSASFAVVGASVVVASTDRFEIAEYSHAGTLLRLVRAGPAGRRITATDVEALRRHMSGQVIDPELREFVAEAHQGHPLPDRAPAFGKLLAAETGDIWVSRFSVVPDSTTTWDVFAPEGAWLGHVVVPGDIEILSVGSDHALATRLDHLDVPCLTMYELTPVHR